MKKIVLVYFLLFTILDAPAQLIINEFETTGLERIEIKNISNQTWDVKNFILCSYPTYNQITDISILTGNYLMAPGDIVVVNGHPLGDTDGELALYLNFNFTNPNAIIDYVEWGSGLHTRETIAVQAGIWSTNDYVPSPPANVSLEYDGTGNASTDWFLQQNPTFGLENGILSVDSDLLQNSIGISVSNHVVFIQSFNNQVPVTAVEVYNNNGELVKRVVDLLNSTATIYFKSNESGVYLFKVFSKNKHMSKKLIIF